MLAGVGLFFRFAITILLSVFHLLFPTTIFYFRKPSFPLVVPFTVECIAIEMQPFVRLVP